MHNRAVRFLLGLAVGFALGYGLSYLMMWLFNWAVRLVDKTPVAMTPWSGVPLGILLGLSMGINFMNPPFGD